MWILVFYKSSCCCGSLSSSQGVWQSGEPYNVKSALLTFRYEASFLFLSQLPSAAFLICLFQSRLLLYFPFEYLVVLLVCICCQDLFKELLFKVGKVEDRLIWKRISSHILKAITAGNNTYWEVVSTGGISALASFPLSILCGVKCVKTSRWY